ncbi:hypothetical protein RSOLAG1IB_11438 [Rhizoctonia solani AG-1 IB]|uniref:Uncharacterized protein n=1 Tax=Thanatephorus cucumeris (strain AG1-IB / isolate 7/3/14) TaxID=1108050 RepID=A0A0B7FBV8_THACB|nr:hypothetical protein RSOLAG1IB_11438 [Rhizoctonia solani AG-1 IB]
MLKPEYSLLLGPKSSTQSCGRLQKQESKGWVNEPLKYPFVLAHPRDSATDWRNCWPIVPLLTLDQFSVVTQDIDHTPIVPLLLLCSLPLYIQRGIATVKSEFHCTGQPSLKLQKATSEAQIRANVQTGITIIIDLAHQVKVALVA